MYCIIKATLSILFSKITISVDTAWRKKYMELIYLNSISEKEIIYERGCDHVHGVRYYFNLGSF